MFRCYIIFREACNGFFVVCRRVVNGALEYLAKDLGIANDTVLQGKSDNSGLLQSYLSNIFMSQTSTLR